MRLFGMPNIAPLAEAPGKAEKQRRECDEIFDSYDCVQS